MTQLDKHLLAALIKIIVWILKNKVSVNSFRILYATLPKDVLQLICATRYYGRPDSEFTSINEAVNYISDPTNFADHDLVEKIIDIIPETLDQQLNDGFNKI